MEMPPSSAKQARMFALPMESIKIVARAWVGGSGGSFISSQASRVNNKGASRGCKKDNLLPTKKLLLVEQAIKLFFFILLEL